MRKRLKLFSVLVTLCFIYGLVFPLTAVALTGGPSQPEVQSFEPIGTSQMVDVSSGDFVYNIPLLDAGGYPINISYHAGIGMDQEASWVGLGWNINPGVVNRNMRSLPDDFNGDQVVKEFNMKPNQTYGGSFGLSGQLFGFKVGSVSLSGSLGVFYNNYKGVGFEMSLRPGLSIGDKAKSTLNAGMGLSANSESGIGLSPSLSFSKVIRNAESKDIEPSVSIGASFNSRSGLKALSLSSGISVGDVGKNSKGKDEFGADGQRSLGSSISFCNPTYTPQIQMPMVNSSFSFSGTAGIEIFGLHPNLQMTGYFSEQKLLTNSSSIPAYGYFNSQNAGSQTNVLLDFNREKDIPFSDNTPHLPVTNFAYDIYSVSGQGIGGQYKPNRSDIGTVYDDRGLNTNTSYNLGVELGGGNGAHFGADLNANVVNTETGKWQQDNTAFTDLSFKGSNQNDPLYEPYYMKNIGEKTPDPDNGTSGFFNRIGGFNPVRIGLDDSKMDVPTTRRLVNSSDNETNYKPTANLSRKKRQRRNEQISFLNANEASEIGLQKKIFNYPLNVFINPNPTQENRVTGTSSSDRKAHHVSEVVTTREDGTRYVYGIPAYNTDQIEATFSVAGNSNPDYSNGTIDYTDEDNSTGNKKGLDNYYSSTRLPAYAHSYLLTAILSADYVDVTGDGPTPDDLGTYTLITYSKTNAGYHWRTPYGGHKAAFNEGLKADENDDKGSFTYGQKEYWYVHTIETKNYVAEFYLTKREDCLGVIDKNGGKNTADTLQKLTKITLYSKPDRVKNGAAAIPIKVVHFEYDYSLCANILNNSGNTVTVDGANINAAKGKLTLKKIYFTYGNSQKARLNSYQFVYGTQNPSYNLKGYDRWGNYAPNTATSLNDLSTSDFPYVDQSNRSNADANAASWSLDKIILPSGGIIDIKYEADDYAYVQDKRAMQMFKVLGVGSSSSPGSTTYDKLMDPKSSGNGVNNYIYFDLQTAIPSSTPNARDILTQDYIGDISNSNEFMYYKFFISLDNSGKKEYVPGYCHIIDYGFLPAVGGNYTMGYIKTATVKVNDKGNHNAQVNPISRSAWQFARLNEPRIAYGGATIKNTGGEQMVKSLATIAGDMEKLFNGFNETLRDHDYGKTFEPSKSWIRLYNPNKMKVGGGLRVKQITVKDEWGTMISDPTMNFSYGQSYKYTITETQSNGNKREVSTGVASYEPLVGGDEIPFRKPIFFDEDHVMAPDDEHYMETPFGESFFPSPSIVYSQVTVSSLTPDYSTGNNGKSVRTGSIVHQFYTAKDFPTITNGTGLKPVKKKADPILSFLKLDNREYMTASEGYVVELNDMHGKPKAEWVYAENNPDPISGTEYIYKTVPGKPYQLDNNVQVIDKRGNIQTDQVGVDVDMVGDCREGLTTTQSMGLQGNVDGFLLFIVPVVVPTIIPSYTKELVRFRSYVTTKVINRYGILQKVKVHQDQAQISTDNLAYDQETGQVLLTRTINEFEDSVFNFTYPAHWEYDRMGPAYKNIGVSFSGVSINSYGDATIPNSNLYFVNGDELLIEAGGYAYKGWVLKVGGGYINIADKDGNAILCNNAKIKIIRSGRRNQQNTPIGNLTSLKNPIVGTSLSVSSSTQVVNASAIEFSENWQTLCGLISSVTPTCSCGATNESADLLRLLNKLANRHELYKNSIPLWSSTASTPYYPAYYSDTLRRNYSSANPHLWCSSIVDSIFYGSISDNCESSNCQIVLHGTGTLDTDFVSFSNITPIYTTGCTTDSCPEVTQYFTVDVTKINGSIVTLHGNSTCYPIGRCTKTIGSTYRCGLHPNDIVNPYAKGILGNWRAKQTYHFYTDRTQSNNTNNNTDIRKDGTFSSFTPFWGNPSSVSDPWLRQPTNWTSNSQITKYNPFGDELENKDALGNYSSDLFGYNYTMVTGVAMNAKYTQIGFDNFEDYAFEMNQSGCTNAGHWNFEKDLLSGTADTTSTESHTGKYSMKVTGNDADSVSRSVGTACADCQGTKFYSYSVKGTDCIGRFSPDTGKYVLSAWIKEKNSGTSPITSYTKGEIQVELTVTGHAPVVYTLHPSGSIIDGWQRVSDTFSVVHNTTDIKVRLIAGSTIATYFDDIRVHPFLSNMKTYVYDPISLKLVALLDENNYATIYEYNEEGILTRVKKETKDGVFTIQETRQANKKQ